MAACEVGAALFVCCVGCAACVVLLFLLDLNMPFKAFFSPLNAFGAVGCGSADSAIMKQET